MEPTVRVEQVAVRPGDVPARWLVTWRIENHGDRPLTVLAARCPHGKFRCEEKELSPALDLKSNKSGEIELEVRCGEPAGATIENAFLILRVVWDDKPWLILARLRVLVNSEGVLETLTELITTQPVGFSLPETAG